MLFKVQYFRFKVGIRSAPLTIELGTLNPIFMRACLKSYSQWRAGCAQNP
jgi:hypothetical protein